MTDQSDDAANQQYWKNVDEFIQLANRLAEQQGMDRVSSGLLYAAARFSAFNAATKYGDREQLQQDSAEAVKYFTSIFRGMFEENIADYSEHFEKYILPPSH